ncbi:MAG: TM0106 family RecB-like putative nuclease [Gordonia sp. (in: high G+C Gram-positive bacteria)]|uniref:TM0106 family RecB-like putative nuclease n=1 Tax=Gordonia sp. (in: high G+C Gram-positive bacteria) TaxID=84139 RepID=UPI0039E5EF21
MDSAVLGARNLTGCEHRLALDFAAVDRGAPLVESTEAARRIEAAQAHREAVVATLLDLQAARPDAVAVVDDHANLRDRVAATLAACATDAEWILHAAFPPDEEKGRRGHAEVLVRDGDGYIPIIIVNHRTTVPVKGERDPEAPPPALRTSPLGQWRPQPDATRIMRANRRDTLRLAQLAAMLGDLDYAVSADRREWVGGVIGVDADCIAVVPLGEVMDEYDDLLARRRAIAQGLVPTRPRRVNECRSCALWPHCEAQLIAADDVSLVIGGAGGTALQDAGITTVAQLAAYRGEAPEEWPNNVSFRDAVVNANCRRLGVPLVRRLDRPQVQRADVEVDVDMESYGERGAYMWGTLLTDNVDPEPVVYRAFVTWDPLPTQDEGRSFGEFWTWLMRRRAQAHAQGKTFAAYCYSQQAENRWLRGSADRFAGQPGVPSRADVDAFIDSDEWVDIYEAVNANFICPDGKGLKRIAPVAGFGWRDDEAGGEASMEWYALAVGLDDGPTDLTQRERLLQYNEDDVQATKVLREWLSSTEILALPTADEILQGQRHSGP